MAHITFDRVGATDAPASRRPGVFARLFSALADARMREAQRELRRHRHLLPRELELSGNRLTERNEEDLPFGGW